MFLELHDQCIYHREKLDQTTTVSCFYCCKVYPREEIKEYIDDGQTAMCSYCGIDSVLPLEIDTDVLQQMNFFWFNQTNVREFLEKGIGSMQLFEQDLEKQVQIRALAREKGARSCLVYKRGLPAHESNVYRCPDPDCEQAYPCDRSGKKCVFCEKVIDQCKIQTIYNHNIVYLTFDDEPLPKN